jgi:hypothetical protein
METFSVLLALAIVFLIAGLIRTRAELRLMRDEVRAYARATTNDLLVLHNRLLAVEDFLTKPREQSDVARPQNSKQNLPN